MTAIFEKVFAKTPQKGVLRAVRAEKRETGAQANKLTRNEKTGEIRPFL